MVRLHHGLGVSALVLCSLAVPSLYAQSSAVPSPWSARDVGSPTPAGSSSYDSTSGTFTEDGGGSDIWGTSDKFHFVYQAVSGNVDIVARVDSITQADQWSKSGLMIRASLNANSAHAFALVSAGKGTAFQRRKANGGESTNTTGPAARAPYWVRLVRSGTTVTAYVSSNGTSWSSLGSDTIALGTTAYVGIATTSHNSSATTTAEVSHVVLSSSSDSTSTLPSGLVDADVGAPAIKGSVAYSSGKYTITAGGIDIWDNSDQFNFIYKQVTGDVDLIARVVSLTNADPYSKAAVMVRETLNANSRHASTFLTYSAGYRFTRRVSTGGTSVSANGSTTAAPGWVRLKRNGSLFTSYESKDGTNWTVIGTDSISLASTVYVGIAVSSVNASQSIQAVVDSLSITAGGTTNQPPTVTLTAPANGSSYTAPANMTLTATASDPEGKLAKVEFYRGSTLLGTDTSSPFSFSWTNVAAGTYSLTAVAYDTAGLTTTSNAASVTVGTTTNKPPTVSLTAPSSGATFTAGATISLAATASDPEGKLAKVEFYRGSTLIGTDTSSPFTSSWTNAAAGSYSLTAVAYDTAGLKTTSAAVPVTVSTATTGAPRYVAFQKSADHDTLVTSYKLNIYASGANPSTATPVSSVSLGKPTPDSSGNIQVDEQSFFNGLAAGNYIATVAAVGAGGTTQSSSVSFTR
jgi:regulation of enolase protein 1 (concanavalin A-like superfamily)